MARECQAWQARSAAHRLAFERGTDLWMDAAGVNRVSVARATSVSEPTSAVRLWRLKSLPFAAALTTAVLAGVLVLKPWRDGDSYITGVGEQRVVMLGDGTRMSLNTSTRVRVVLGATRRTVEVEGGEALFEVAKDAGRPFVVRAAGSEVVATGTAFVVRYTPAIAGIKDAVDVTLVEGRVVVRGAVEGVPSMKPVSSVEMSPGEHLRIDSRSRAQGGLMLRPEIDRPRVDQVLAWKHGEAIFDNVSLLEAVAEMNRYSTRPIVFADVDSSGGLRISGVFKTGDNLSFARAVASLHGLAVRDRSDRLELASR
jgi:transmembrane sensor